MKVWKLVGAVVGTMLLALVSAQLIGLQREVDVIYQAVQKSIATSTSASNSGSASTGILPTEPLQLRGDEIVRGNKSAPVALIEYSDFLCPFCGEFARTTLPNLLHKYVDTGNVQFAFRPFPLESLHPGATAAAQAAVCAGSQGHFWELHDALFRDPSTIASGAARELEHHIGVDLASFDRCLANAEKSEPIDRGDATRYSISGTPTFFLGRVQPDGRVKISARFDGAVSLSTLSSSLDTALSEGPSANSR